MCRLRGGPSPMSVMAGPTPGPIFGREVDRGDAGEAVAATPLKELRRAGGRGGSAHAAAATSTPTSTQGLTLVHFSAQAELLLVIDPPTDTEYPTKRAYIEPQSGQV